jgi:hypothetical protein
MFYKCRQVKEGEWAVLLLGPSVLWKMDCAFCKHNAADSRIASQPLEVLKREGAFRDMFAEIEGMRSRTEQRLRSYDPTDIQAEVLVFEAIPPEQIAEVAFQTKQSRDIYRKIIGGRRDHVHGNNKGLFASRSYVREFAF